VVSGTEWYVSASSAGGGVRDYPVEEVISITKISATKEGNDERFMIALFGSADLC
jgi:hypothetical protein